MKYFTIKELCKSETARRNGIDNTPSKQIEQNLVRLIDTILDRIREEYGSAIRVSSGYRCKLLNSLVGGAKNSQHLYGEAADLVPVDGNTRRLFDICKKLMDEGVIECGQLIWEYGDKNSPKWVHISLPNTKHHNEVKYIFK